jgi:hypothetical protein
MDVSELITCIKEKSQESGNQTWLSNTFTTKTGIINECTCLLYHVIIENNR